MEGDGTGYDIMSFNPDGSLRYVEVKTTTGGKGTPFIMTINELKFSQEFAHNYHLYRVYNLKKTAGAAQFYELKGAVDDTCSLEPIQFRVKPK